MAETDPKKRGPAKSGGGGHTHKKPSHGKRKFKKPEPRLTPKELKLKRQKARPHFDTVARAKEIWNRLREKGVEKAERRALMEKLLPLIRGKMAEVAMKHDASRVVQTAIKHATEAERAEIVAELVPHAVEMSKAQFSHFVVKTLFQYCSSEQHDKLVRQFRDKVAKLGTHSVAAHVVEAAFTWLRPAQWQRLRREFYGQEFAYFGDADSVTLRSALATKGAAGTGLGSGRAALQNVGAAVQRLIAKNLLDLAFAHELVLEWFDAAGATREAVELATALQDGVLQLCATRKGAEAACRCMALAGPKARKHMVKAMREHALRLVCHPHGYLLVMRTFDVVDDTVLLGKQLLAELRGELRAVATHPQGRKVLLQLLRPRCATYNDPSELQLLQPALLPEHVASGGGAEGEDGGGGQGEGEGAARMVSTSKKDPERRRHELLSALQPALEDLCATQAPALLRDASGADVLVEVVLLWGSEQVVTAVVDAAVAAQPSEAEQQQAAASQGGGGGGDEDPDAAGDVEEEADGDDGDEDDGEEGEPWVAAQEDVVGHRTLCRLVDAASFSGSAATLDGSTMAAPSDDFGVRLAQRLLQSKGLAVEWARSTRGAHVIAYLLRGLVDADPLRRELLSKKAKLTKLRKREPQHGVGLVLDFLDGKLIGRPRVRARNDSGQAAESAEPVRSQAAEGAPGGEGGTAAEPAAKKRRDATGSTKTAKKRKVNRK